MRGIGKRLENGLIKWEIGFFMIWRWEGKFSLVNMVKEWRISCMCLFLADLICSY